MSGGGLVVVELLQDSDVIRRDVLYEWYLPHAVVPLERIIEFNCGISNALLTEKDPARIFNNSGKNKFEV